jgi:hypothetical protein
MSWAAAAMRALGGPRGQLFSQCTCLGSAPQLGPARRGLPASTLVILGQQLRLAHVSSHRQRDPHRGASRSRVGSASAGLHPQRPGSLSRSGNIYRPAAGQHAGPRQPRAAPARQPPASSTGHKGVWANGAPKPRRHAVRSSAATGAEHSLHAPDLLTAAPLSCCCCMRPS